MKLNEFDYHLPEELIAQEPVEPRDSSRLLIVNKETGELSHKKFRDILNILQPGDLLVTNNSKVIPARLLGEKVGTGAKVEVVLLHREDKDAWHALVKPGKKLKPGTSISFGNETMVAEVMSTTDVGGRILRFKYEGVFEEILDKLGNMPLPPYIKKQLSDKDRYQTVYAKEKGSAAAPTAGLHFTEELITELKEKKIEWAEVLLHVGLGTFRPVAVENIEEHKMHQEFYRVTKEAAEKINNAKIDGRRVIAVGTTAVRALETAAARGEISDCEGWTDIFIYPGYQFRVIDGLITNFHLPKSTLMMLVSALSDKEKIMKAYNSAIEERYRFFSFGDAMLII
ncbi:S-adenosylmethionine:tRNA ribosyltransferase-isomerase [Desulfitispora alkaliphila]|uniref:tRNA preQ1(34) S-adenosylmethionine ribosyltransferase-isomerase QueA n=1 Tax=Desulfitispora alkaliphila TaxID=622674 RepID=UPI003D1DC501